MDGPGDPLPGFGLRVRVDSGDVGVAAVAGTDHGGFGDEESTRGCGTLLVVVFDGGKGDMVAVCAEAGHRGHCDAVV